MDKHYRQWTCDRCGRISRFDSGSSHSDQPMDWLGLLAYEPVGGNPIDCGRRHHHLCHGCRRDFYDFVGNNAVVEPRQP